MMKQKGSITINSINGVTFADFLKVLNPIVDDIESSLDDRQDEAEQDYHYREANDDDEDVEDFIKCSELSKEDIFLEYGPNDVEIDFMKEDFIKFYSLCKQIKKNNKK